MWGQIMNELGKVGLVIGRFQPFHHGHMHLIKAAYKKVDTLIIVIGSAQESHTMRNPFTAGERIAMMYPALKNAEIDNFLIVPVMDISRYAIWVAHIQSLIPKIDIVFTNNGLTRLLFENAGYEVEGTDNHDRRNCSGSNIRALLAQETISYNHWSDYLPKGTAEFISRIKGYERIKNTRKVK